MIKEALEFLKAEFKPVIIDISERNYSTCELHEVREPEVEPIRVSSLSSLISYIKNDPDDNREEQRIINIDSPVHITLESDVFGQFAQRETFVDVNYSKLVPDIYFGRFVGTEEFIIMLKSRFEMTEDLEALLKVVGNISDENVTNYNDDGITQKVTMRTGIARVGEVALPPKITLKPYRTFVEVDQPESEFLLRARKGCGDIEFALFEADGGAWQRTAIKNISKYIEKEISNVKDLEITILD